MRKNNGIPRVVDLLDVDMNKVGDVNFVRVMTSLRRIKVKTDLHLTFFSQ